MLCHQGCAFDCVYFTCVKIIFNTLACLVFHEDSESVVFSAWLYLHTTCFGIVIYHGYCMSSFYQTTFTDIVKTYGVGRRFCSLVKVVWKNELVYIFMDCRLTCSCIYLRQAYLELMAKSLRQKYAPSYSSPDSRLWCNISTRWPQNNQVKCDTREYFQRYLTKMYPKVSYFVIIERSEWSLWGSIFGLQALNSRNLAKCNALFVVFLEHSKKHSTHLR